MRDLDSASVCSVITAAKRLVIKIGSSLITNEGRGIDHVAMRRWAAQIVRLRDLNKQVTLVSSGAIAEGVKRLGWRQRPRGVEQLQAAAAVGQMGLAQAYESCFSRYGIRTAQILLTHADIADRERYLNARSTLRTLLEMGVVPIINENDTVVTDEIRFGDNDTLGALVTHLVEADVLVILTDQNGLYTTDPRTSAFATLITAARADDPALEVMAGGPGTHLGQGGMLTKVRAAQRAARGGAHTVIGNGREPNILVRSANGEIIGTQLWARASRMTARKQWMTHHLQLRGRVVIDDGACAKLMDAGKSLLPIGVVEVQGEFARGEVIACMSQSGGEIARGLTNYSSAQAHLICRRSSAEIEAILGYMLEPELIHRDNLVLT